MTSPHLVHLSITFNSCFLNDVSFNLDVDVAYSIYPFISTNPFKMECIVLPMKCIVAYNKEHVKKVTFHKLSTC